MAIRIDGQITPSRDTAARVIAATMQIPIGAARELAAELPEHHLLAIQQSARHSPHLRTVLVESVIELNRRDAAPAREAA